MRIAEARAIAANPSEHTDKLRLARLKLGNAALRSFPSSPKQKGYQDMVARIEAIWVYP